MITTVIPGLRVDGRRDIGLVFTICFYLIGLLMLWRVDVWRGLDPASQRSLVAVLVVVWIAAIALPRVGRGRYGPNVLRKRFRGNGLATVGLVLLLVIILASILAPLLATADPIAIEDPAETRYQSPSKSHPLGTDRFGRDIWSRLLFGARTSLGIAVMAVLLAIVLGIILGGVSGTIGGTTDEVIMRGADAVLAFPRLLLVLTVVALFSNTVGLLILTLGLTGAPGIARLVRGEVIRIGQLEFVRAAVATGMSRTRVLCRHVLPAIMGPLVVTATLNIGAVILLESYLSFLGLGVQPPAPTWGSMVFDGRDVLLSAWWVSTFPAIAIAMAVIAFNLVGDGLRDVFDEKGTGSYSIR